MVVQQGLEIKQPRSFRWIAVLFWLGVAGMLAAGAWFTYQYFTKGELPPLVEVRALQANPNVDENPVTKQQVRNYTVAKGDPRYISIPSLKVDNTRVFKVGVDKNNVLKAPNNISDAAWYEKSNRPGDGYGAVLINAHNGGITRDGVFAKLGEMREGQQITVERGDGKVFTYKVVENQSMSLEEVNKTGMTMMQQSAEPDKEGLNLITCDGKWVPALQQFDRRIMLRAVRIS